MNGTRSGLVRGRGRDVSVPPSLLQLGRKIVDNIFPGMSVAMTKQQKVSILQMTR
tara:strand:- start:657 stop:821 length:165 start_codon:yes stop_codon:yes gene_type:complete